MAYRLGARRGRAMSSLGALASVGFAFAFAILIGAGVGLVLDSWLGTKPWLFLLFFCFGVAAAIRNLFKTVGALSGPAPEDRPPGDGR